MKILLIILFSSLHIFAYSLKIHGVVEKPYGLNKKQFDQIKQTNIKDISVVCNTGEVKQKPKELKGVLLMQLIQDAQIDIKNKKKLNQIVVLAKASDKYAVTFSYNELFNTEIGNNVLVVWENDSFSLYSKKDFVTGSRHVYDLVDIDIQFIK